MTKALSSCVLEEANWFLKKDKLSNLTRAQQTIYLNKDKGSIDAIKTYLPNEHLFHCSWHRKKTLWRFVRVERRCICDGGIVINWLIARLLTKLKYNTRSTVRLTSVASKIHLQKRPKRGTIDLNFCLCNFDDFFRGTRLGSDLVPLRSWVFSHQQKLRSNAPLFEFEQGLCFD